MPVFCISARLAFSISLLRKGNIAGPGFIGIREIQEIYLKNGFSQFKIEGYDLGSAVVLEFLLCQLRKPEHRLEVREEINLSSSPDLF